MSTLYRLEKGLPLNNNLILLKNGAIDNLILESNIEHDDFVVGKKIVYYIYFLSIIII